MAEVLNLARQCVDRAEEWAAKTDASAKRDKEVSCKQQSAATTERPSKAERKRKLDTSSRSTGMSCPYLESIKLMMYSTYSGLLKLLYYILFLGSCAKRSREYTLVGQVTPRKDHAKKDSSTKKTLVEKESPRKEAIIKENWDTPNPSEDVIQYHYDNFLMRKKSCLFYSMPTYATDLTIAVTALALKRSKLANEESSSKSVEKKKQEREAQIELGMKIYNMRALEKRNHPSWSYNDIGKEVEKKSGYKRQQQQRYKTLYKVVLQVPWIRDFYPNLNFLYKYHELICAIDKDPKLRREFCSD